AEKFGDQVVVVRIEPLGHFERGYATVAGHSTGHGEAQVQWVVPTTVAVAGRNGVEPAGRIQHMVVECEFSRGNMVDSRLLLPMPVLSADGGGCFLQLAKRNAALPISFDCSFQFPVWPD